MALHCEKWLQVHINKKAACQSKQGHTALLVTRNSATNSCCSPSPVCCKMKQLAWFTCGYSCSVGPWWSPLERLWWTLVIDQMRMRVMPVIDSEWTHTDQRPITPKKNFINVISYSQIFSEVPTFIDSLNIRTPGCPAMVGWQKSRLNTMSPPGSMDGLGSAISNLTGSTRK